MAFLRSIFAKLTRRPKDEAVELIRIHPVPPVIGPDAWHTRMIVLGAKPIRSTRDLDIAVLLERKALEQTARRMVELDWEMALDEEAIREAMKEAMPADAPSRSRARRRL